MNFQVFSTTALKAALREKVQKRHAAYFSGFFRLAFLNFQ